MFETGLSIRSSVSLPVLRAAAGGAAGRRRDSDLFSHVTPSPNSLLSRTF